MIGLLFLVASFQLSSPVLKITEEDATNEAEYKTKYSANVRVALLLILTFKYIFDTSMFH